MEKYVIEQNKNSSNIADNLKFDESLNFNNIQFKYQNRNQNILENFNLNINKGKVTLGKQVGIGKNNSNKSYLWLLKPSSEKITVDDKDIHQNLNGWQKINQFHRQLSFR